MAIQLNTMSEIIFDVKQDQLDGGYVATASDHGLVSQGSTLEELRERVKDTVNGHFEDDVPDRRPKVRLRFIGDEEFLEPLDL